MKSKYGKVIAGYGTTEQKELDITEFVRANYADNRVISICAIEGGSYICSVENPESTGRNPQSKMWLSKESLIGLLSTAALYFTMKGENTESLLKDAVGADHIDYVFSDNLKAIE